jgi:RNA polymerase sigma-54 factor
MIEPLQPTPALQVTQRQQHSVTPRLQRAVRLLQLSSLDFAQEVQDAMGKNPFLELEDTTPEAPGATDDAAPARPLDAEPAAAPDEAIEAEIGRERDSWQASPASLRRSSGEADIAALDLVVAEVGLRSHLRAQIQVLPLSQRDHALACSVIESLDDDGYLRTDLAELASLSELDPPVDLAEMQVALSHVQSLDPCGVAARSVRECLLLQLPSVDDVAQRDLARRIIVGQLERLAHHDVSAMARALRSTPFAVESACERIRHLDPRPGWRYSVSDVHYVMPDIIVRKVRGRWIASLNRAVIPRVRLNHVYASLFQQHREAQHAELAAHLQEARWTVRNVQQRFSTILTVAEAILKRQHHFLEFGPMAMKPLGLREIADELGLHESTVSRVTNNKYMATPAGVYELKYFFSREMPTASGGACSATAIRGVIRGMIEGENPTHPLSDAQIARLLARQGLKVARRTVTTYRQLLKLPPIERRRQLPGDAAGSAPAG